MDRKEFLATLGGAGLTALLPIRAADARTPASSGHPLAKAEAPACFLTPAVNEGPFYINANLVRKEIADGHTGIPITYTFTVFDVDCAPIANALVDIWQCDKDGVYSGYAGQPGGLDTTGQTFLRGVQMTDASGQCTFTSIYPGWYPNRLTHLHVKIHFQNAVQITTNLFYPDSLNATIYATDLYKAKGPNPTTVAQDVELHGDNTRFTSLQPKFDPDGNGGYTASYSFGISAHATDLMGSAQHSPGQFTFRKNFPNPVQDKTTLVFSLLQSSRVHIEIFDSHGRKVDEVAQERMGAGEHRLVWDRRVQGLPGGEYECRLTVENGAGRFVRGIGMRLL